MSSLLLSSVSDLDIANNTDNEIIEENKELQHDYSDALEHLPEILQHIERLRKIVRKQRKKINKLNHKLKKDHKGISVGTQTWVSGIDVKPDIVAAPSLAGDNEETEETTFDADKLVEQVKEAAENAVQQTSFVYEPTSGMYYDYSTGYYYNAELRLYYDGNQGKYLYYDEETKEYKFYEGETPDIENKPVVKPKESQKRKPFKKSKNNTRFSCDVDELTSSLGSLRVYDAANAIDAARGCEPCIRIMVDHTTVERLRVGSLFVVPCTGGTLGREGDHAVLVPDINVSKHHARFLYDEATRSYTLTDLGSRNGTWLDGRRLSVALQESDPRPVAHGAVIQVGGSRLVCHVHTGRDTCSGCEPGLAQPVSAPAVIPTVVFKEQLQNLRKKFGVGGSGAMPTGYEDRAELRRATVGSSHHSEKTQTAHVDEFIPKSNKGFAMLARMGWSEGQKLGKEDRGLAEPVPLVSNEGKSGLGAAPQPPTALTAAMKKKQTIIRKTQDRFRNIKEAAAEGSD